MNTRINGKVFDWADIKLNIPGLYIEATDISYDDALEKEHVYGLGNRPRGYGTGNYSSNLKLTMSKEDFDAFLDYCKKNGKKLYTIVIDKIVVSYANEGKPTSIDELMAVTFTKTNNKGSQGDKGLKVELEGIIVGGIIRNGMQPI